MEGEDKELGMLLLGKHQVVAVEHILNLILWQLQMLLVTQLL
jgi:hypothetical protein